MIKKIAFLIGIISILSGLAGFIPGLSGYDSEGRQLLLGVFATSTVTNIGVIIYGILGIGASGSTKWSKIYLIVGGLACALAALIGFIDPSLGYDFNMNMADNWANLISAIILLGVAYGVHPDYKNPPSRASKKSKTK